jgi:hypothetical protein
MNYGDPIELRNVYIRDPNNMYGNSTFRIENAVIQATVGTMPMQVPPAPLLTREEVLQWVETANANFKEKQLEWEERTSELETRCSELEARIEMLLANIEE